MIAHSLIYPWLRAVVLKVFDPSNPRDTETNSLKGVQQGQIYSHLNMPLPFSYFDICTDGTKAIVSETSGILA